MGWVAGDGGETGRGAAPLGLLCRRHKDFPYVRVWDVMGVCRLGVRLWGWGGGVLGEAESGCWFRGFDGVGGGSLQITSDGWRCRLTRTALGRERSDAAPPPENPSPVSCRCAYTVNTRCKPGQLASSCSYFLFVVANNPIASHSDDAQ